MRLKLAIACRQYVEIRNGGDLRGRQQRNLASLQIAEILVLKRLDLRGQKPTYLLGT